MSILLKQWATGIAGGFSWSAYWTQLLTEAGDNLVAENDDILLTEQNITEE